MLSLGRSRRLLVVVLLAAAGAGCAGAGCAGTGSTLRSPGEAAGGAIGGGNRAAPQTPPPPALDLVATPPGTFLVAPYLQLGNTPTQTVRESLALLWQTPDKEMTATTPVSWTVEVRALDGAVPAAWRKVAAAPTSRRVNVEGIEPQRLWQTTLPDLSPGKEFDYRVLKNGKPVFSARARPRKRAGEPYRFVVFGDCAAGTPAQKAVAFEAYQARPDFVFLTGDIVYNRGRLSEYQSKFFPVYNADAADAKTGAPLLRSTLFLAAPGNHDILNRDLDQNADALGYFLNWSQPLNGPLQTPGAPNTPTLSGEATRQKTFLATAGEAYPRMANFSFDYAGAHWTVLDANPYVNWTDPTLRAWVDKDLQSAKGATWRFVAFHQPGFHSSKSHFAYQKMRLLAPVFEKNGVDVVFSGHVHNYQRTFPLRFVAAGNEDAKNSVAGAWTLDKDFDGKTNTRPSGVIYVVTGAGGANLYNPEQQNDPGSLQPFTARYIADTHSLTVADVDGKKLTLKQISDTGKELDAFTITKP